MREDTFIVQYNGWRVLGHEGLEQHTPTFHRATVQGCTWTRDSFAFIIALSRKISAISERKKVSPWVCFWGSVRPLVPA